MPILLAALQAGQDAANYAYEAVQAQVPCLHK